MKETSGMKRLTSWASQHRSGLLLLLFLAVAAPFSSTITQIVAGNGLTGGGNGGSVTVSLSAPVSRSNGGTGSATGDLSAVNALTAPLLTASTRVDSPSIGTSSSTQHSLPSGTATLLAADSALPAANLTGDVALARIATSLAAGGNTIKGTVVTATTRTETPTIGTDSTNQHALGTGTGALLDANSSLPAANLTGNVAVARIATALAAGGNPITGTVQTATTRTETPTVGTSSSTQHALPAGTADILTADSTATITGKSIDAGQLTGNVLVARIVTALAAGGNPITGTVLTATTRVETPTIGTASGTQHALPGGTEEILAPARGTAGQILTSAGAGSAPAMAAPITATSGEATLSGTFAISGSTGVYQDTGLSISLPSAGTYLILGTVRSAINTTANYGRVVAKLVNSTDAIDVPGGGCVGARTQAVSVTNEVQSPIVAIYTVLAAKTINLYGARIDDVPAPTYLVSQISTAASGPTKLSYIKLN